MGYHIDLKSISLDQYREMLKTKTLIPSWKILTENLDQRIEALKEIGFTNIDDLLKTLKNKKKLAEIVDPPTLSEEFLTVLKREINSKLSKPNRFIDFTFLDTKLTARLTEKGIKNTKNLFDKIVTPVDRENTANELNISETDILLLTKVTDLSRIQWVNHTFAYVLCESGYDTTEKVKNADPEVLYNSIKQLNKEKNLYKGNIGLNDMRILVEAAQIVPLDIVY